MVIEFQITRSELEQLLHERIIAARPCITQPLQFLNDDFYVVGIEVGVTKLATAQEEDSFPLNAVLGGGEVGVPTSDAVFITLNRLQLEQGVDVLVSSEDMLRSANTDPPTVLHITATIVYDLSIDVTAEGRPRLCAHVSEIRDLELPDPAMEDQVIATIESRFAQCANFGLGALAQMAGGTPPIVVNGGIAATPNLSRVAIRFDTNPSSASAGPAWTSFFAGSFPSLLFGQEWALLLPHELLIPPMLERFEAQLQTADDFSLDSGPDGSWTPLGPVPVLTVTFAGELIDACVGIDVDVDVTLTVAFTVPQPNVLRTSVSISWDGDFWEELACETLAASFWPIVGAMFLEEGKLEWWEFLLGFAAGPAGVFIATIAYLSTDEPASQIPDPPDWIKDSDTEWHQDTTFPTTFANVVTGLTLAGAFATPAGLVLAGTIAPVSPLAPSLGVAAGGFQGWGVERPCSNPFGYVTEAKIAYWAEPMGPTPRLPLQVCNVQIVNDPLGQYTTHANVSGSWGALQSSASTKVTLHGLLAEFAADPYPLEALVQSNNGTRWVSIPPPPPLPEQPDTPEEWQEFQLAYLKWKATHCWKFISIWGIIGMLNPKWLIDPPPDEIVAQAWWVMAEQLTEGEVVTLRDDLGRELATTRADARGRAEVSAVIERAGPETGISIARDGAALSAAEWERRAVALPLPTSAPAGGLRVKQVLLVQLAEVTLDATAQWMNMESHRGTPVLLVETERGPAAYSLAAPRLPQRLTRGEVVAAFPQAMASRGTAPGMPTPNTSCDPAEQVLDEDASGGFTYELRGDGLHVLDRDGCQVTHVALSNGCGLAVARDRLAVATDEGIAVFDVCRPQDPIAGRVHRVAGVLGVQRAEIVAARRAVYARRRSGPDLVLDVSDPDHPAVVAEYGRRPWYADGVRHKRLYARLDDARRRVALYQLAESATGFERSPLASDIWLRGSPPADRRR